jgi:hypothetical protein
LEHDLIERPDWHPSWHEFLAAKKISEGGGILWPPTAEYVVGVEVKCAYFSDRLHSTKGSKSHVKGIRKQVSRLERMGVDRAALLDVIANPQSGGVNANAWLEAAGRAQHSLCEMTKTLEGRLAPESAAAHLVWSVGAVIGGDESIRGAGIPNVLRPGRMNPGLTKGDGEVLANRKTLLDGISELLRALPQPTFFPAVFAACRSCKTISKFNGQKCDCIR